MKKIFQIFGSKSSEDYDVIVFVEKVPNTEDAKNLCHKFDKELYMTFVDKGMKIKKINTNLAVIKDGIIIQVHKGTSDEVNNSLLDTYDLHEQFYPQQITRVVDRDIDIKIMRSSRFMLMYLSRSEYRFDVKLALKSNFIKKIKTLESVDLSEVRELGEKGVDWKDYLKSMCFQISQSIALMESIELYTKEDLIGYFPELEEMLMRTGEDLDILEKYKDKFTRLCKLRMKEMKTFDEYKK